MVDCCGVGEDKEGGKTHVAWEEFRGSSISLQDGLQPQRSEPPSVGAFMKDTYPLSNPGDGPGKPHWTASSLSQQAACVICGFNVLATHA